MGDTVRTLIEAVQPYHRRNPLVPPLLSLIRDFDDTDKHSLLNVAVHWQQQAELKTARLPPPHRITALEWNSRNIENGAEIVTFTVEPPSKNVSYQVETTFTIGLCHAPGPTGIEVSAVRRLLEMLCEEVRTVVEVVGMKV